jgi:hypothetical protein
MSTSSEQQSEKNTQNKTISGLTEQLNTLTTAIKLMGKDMAGNGGGTVRKTVSRTANIAADAALDEIPGGKAIAGMIGDTKKYFTGLKERAKKEEESKQKAKDEDTKKLKDEIEKSTKANTEDNKEIVDAIKETTKAIKESNDIAKKAATEEKIKAIKDKDTVAPSELVKPDKTKKDEKSLFGMFGALGATIMGSIFSVIKNVTAFLTAGLVAVGKNIMKGLGVALRFAGRALLFAVRLLNPIGWALLIADLLVTFKDEIIGFFKGDGFKNFIQSTKQLLVDAWNGIIKFFKETDWSGLIQSAAEGISNFIVNLGTWFKDSILSLWEGVKSFVSDLTEVIGVIGSAIYDELLKPLGNWVLDSVKSMWAAVTDKISGWVTDFEVLVSDKWTSAKQFLNEIPNKLMEPFDNLIKWFDTARLGGKLNDLLSGVGDKIVEGFASIYNLTIGKLPGVDKMLPNGKLVSSDDYGEYEKLVGAGDSTQIAAAKIAQMISDREAVNPTGDHPGIFGNAVNGVGNLVGSVGKLAADGASYVYDKGASAIGAVKGFFGRSSSDGKYTIISDKAKITGIKAKGKFDASSKAMQDLLATSTGKDNSLPTGAAGDSVKNNLERVAEQLWDPIKQLDPGAKISSGFRSTEVNQHIDGAVASDHTDGRAIDIMPGPGQTPTSLANAIIANNLPFNKLIVEPSWVHLSLPKEGETAQRLVMIANTAMEGSGKSGKYGPVKVTDVKLTNDLPPGGNISRWDAKALSGNLSAPPTIKTGDMVADGTSSISNARDELNSAQLRSASDATLNTAVANNGNTINNVTVINQTPAQANRR